MFLQYFSKLRIRNFNYSPRYSSPTVVDDATLQLLPCCYMFKIPRFEEQNVNI